MRIGSSGAPIWERESFTVETSTESVMVKLRFGSLGVDHYVCSEPTRTWLNLHHLDRIFSSTDDDEYVIMSAVTSANHQATNINFVYEHHGTDMFTVETNLRGGAIPHHHRDINDSKFSYQVAVGILSGEFRCIIWHFAEPGTQFDDFLLAILSGNYGEFTIRINMLECVDVYNDAVEHSAFRVWLFCSDVNSPDMMIFPVRESIHFPFYMNH